MKAIAVLNYPVEDVFRIFIKNAKRDFSNFNEEDATGCKIEKNINTVGAKPVKCTVEITGYAKNEKYQITTTTVYAVCVSTYSFKSQKDGTTKLILEESQGTDKFFGYMSLIIQRFMSRRDFKARYNNIVESLNNELKTYFNNIERSKKKK